MHPPIRAPKPFSAVLPLGSAPPAFRASILESKISPIALGPTFFYPEKVVIVRGIILHYFLGAPARVRGHESNLLTLFLPVADACRSSLRIAFCHRKSIDLRH